ncbi:MAG TPA: DinB family protein [Cyclobacteriaceae bacterium]|nr:DinB family protein [Cyclobacteriaceae bacterium]HPW62906.1 DinB family protein [Cyclobacteriaceae bacterium]
MKTSKILFTSLFMLLMSASYAQSVDEMVKEWERAKAYTKEYLDAMPEAGYALKPTPEMRSFAEQMLHLTDANYNIIATATGEKPAVKDLEKSTTDKSKANVTNLTLDGYDFVINSIKKITTADLPTQIKLFGRFDLSKGAALQKAFEHQTHHRGQTTVYLRLAKVTPPNEKLF